MNEIIKKPAPHPLPVTVQELEARRVVFHQPTLNDRVDAIHIHLWQNEKYRRYLDAVYDEDAVEGSLSADNLFAALMIRDHAASIDEKYVTGKKLATIARSLNVILKRYEIGRRQRAHEVAGEIIDMSNGGSKSSHQPVPHRGDADE